MKRVDVTYTPVDKSAFVKKVPQRSQLGRLIDEPSLIYCGDKLIAAYGLVSEGVVAAAREIAVAGRGISESTRTEGLPTKSLVHGSLPRFGIRQDYCRISVATRKFKADAVSMFRLAECTARFYETWFPENYAAAKAEVQAQVHSDWAIGDTPYLTANINLNHAIPYHTDAGNFRNHHSNVLILKSGIIGGELVCPEYGISFHQGDRYLTVFDGQAVLHGVLPIQNMPGHKAPYRASIVFYSMKGMALCESIKGELEHFKAKRTKKEARTTVEQRAKVTKINIRRLEKRAKLLAAKKDG